MVSLVDIIDIKKKVMVRGQEIEVEGINAEKLGQLINAYPEMLRLVFAGRTGDITPQMIVSMGPKIVASIIAAAIGKLGDAAEEAAAAKLALGEQINVLAAVLDVTFPDGFGPFVEKLRSLGLAESAAAGSGWAPGMNSQRPSSPSQAATGAKPS